MGTVWILGTEVRMNLGKHQGDLFLKTGQKIEYVQRFGCDLNAP
jgi:hypothetical protein